MLVWWCVAVCVCARLADGARAARPDPGAWPEPEDENLSSHMLQAIEMEPEEGDDSMLARLRSAGCARAALCMEGASCAGALWGRRWLLTRASCVRALRLPAAVVLPLEDVAGCGHSPPESEAIRVLAQFVHPLRGTGYRAYDAALLLLDRAAPVPAHANNTRALLLVPELERWLEYIPAALTASQPAAGAGGLDVAALTSSPLRLLAAAVLLPAAALLLLFALALQLPAAAAIRYDLLEHDALEHAPVPDAGSAGKEEKADEPITERQPFL